MARGLSIALIVATLISVSNAQAQGQPSDAMPRQVRILVPSCDEGPFDADVFIDVLKLEFASHDITLVANEATHWPPNTARVVVDVSSCRQTAKRVTIEVSSHDGRRAQRDLVFTLDERDRRARILALATSAFVTLKWSSLASPDDANNTDAMALLRDELRAAQKADLEELLAQTTVSSEPATARSIVALGVTSSHFAEFSTTVVGASLALSYAVRDHVRLEFGLHSGFGRNRALTGNVKVRTLDASAAVLFGGGQRAWVGVGPRVTLGWARLRGDATNSVTLMIEEDRISRMTGSLAFQLGVRMRLSKRWHGLADAFVGYGFRRLEGRTDDGVRGGAGGATLGILLGVGVAL